MSIDAFVKRFSGGGLGPALPFYYNAEGKPEVILRFYAEKHKYFLVREDGSLEEQSGVTSVCHIVDKSQALMPWAARMCVEQLVRVIPTRVRTADDVTVTVELPIADFTTIANECKSAHKNRVEDAADVGHIAHQALEDTIKHAIENTGGVVLALVNPPTDERALSCCRAAMKWMAAHNVRWIATERKIYSRKYKYAGTLDGVAWTDSCDDYLCCENTKERPAFKDHLSVIDWKTSTALRTDYLMQTAAYLRAIKEELQNAL